ncbi:MAG: hypothetical protein RBG13Loki_0538 [Promethearchaeota archaeon CR_4]|nr:MAG: hypothetical protein RBG13Loki_0538 [Candidatus Lokiarchaeota archaeon CR_4]
MGIEKIIALFDGKKLRKFQFHLTTLVGSCCIVVAIVGGLFWDFFAFWKMEGNVPGIIDGFVAIMPLNTLHFRTLEQPLYVAPDIQVLIGIYLPFLITALLGFVGTFKVSRKYISAAGFVGTFAVPVSMFIVTFIIAQNSFMLSGLEFTGLFSYFQVVSDGENYTIGLWIGFYLCAVGSYVILLGRPKK